MRCRPDQTESLRWKLYGTLWFRRSQSWTPDIVRSVPNRYQYFANCLQMIANRFLKFANSFLYLKTPKIILRGQPHATKISKTNLQNIDIGFGPIGQRRGLANFTDVWFRDIFSANRHGNRVKRTSPVRGRTVVIESREFASPTANRIISASLARLGLETRPQEKDSRENHAADRRRGPNDNNDDNDNGDGARDVGRVFFFFFQPGVTILLLTLKPIVFARSASEI